MHCTNKYSIYHFLLGASLIDLLAMNHLKPLLMIILLSVLISFSTVEMSLIKRVCEYNSQKFGSRRCKVDSICDGICKVEMFDGGYCKGLVIRKCKCTKQCFLI